MGGGVTKFGTVGFGVMGGGVTKFGKAGLPVASEPGWDGSGGGIAEEERIRTGLLLVSACSRE